MAAPDHSTIRISATSKSVVQPLRVVSLFVTADDKLIEPRVVTVPIRSLLSVAVIDQLVSATIDTVLMVATVSMNLFTVMFDGAEPPPSTVTAISARLSFALELVVATHCVL